MKSRFVIFILLSAIIGTTQMSVVHAEYDPYSCPHYDYPYLWSDGYCWNVPEYNNEDFCYDLFITGLEIWEDGVFYQMLFSLPYNPAYENYYTNQAEKILVELEDELDSIQDVSDQNNCDQYQYLLEDDSYLKYRYENVSDKAQQAETYIQYSQNYMQNYDTSNYKQSSGLMDKILEHKDLIKLLVMLI